jgi:DNA repair protein RecN (Recombination protein N)
MLRTLSLRDFVIVRELELDFGAGFCALTGETGAGKSILIDALQLVLGGRGDPIVVREGAARTDITAAFDTPPSLRPWLDEGGFEGDQPLNGDDHGLLLLRRSIDAQGRSRAWINGTSATVAQLRETADHLVDIHGQHAWQSLTRPPAVRALLDQFASADITTLATTWQGWQDARRALERSTQAAGERERERERLAWQLGEVDKLAPGTDEWDALNDEHKRLSHAQALIDAAQAASLCVAEGETDAQTLVSRAVDALDKVASVDARLEPTLEVLRSAQAHLDDAAHSLRSYLQHADLDPQRLAALDERMALWMGLARRFKQPAAELAARHAAWRAELEAIDAASDVEALSAASAQAEREFMKAAKLVSQARKVAAPRLAQTVSAAMQELGMAGGRFEVALEVAVEPQSWGLENVEFQVAGHAGSTPRAIGKVASGGELSRLALAIAVTACEMRGQQSQAAATVIFDEIDAGVGGSVADTVGRLMKRLGLDRQVLAVTHLAQVAANADRHFVVSKLVASDGKTASAVRALEPDERPREIARMLGGEGLNTSLAHARELLERASTAITTTTASPRVNGATKPKARTAGRKRA